MTQPTSDTPKEPAPTPSKTPRTDAIHLSLAVAGWGLDYGKMREHAEHMEQVFDKTYDDLSSMSARLEKAEREREEAEGNAIVSALGIATTYLSQKCECHRDEMGDLEKCPRCTCEDWIRANGGAGLIDLERETVQLSEAFGNSCPRCKRLTYIEGPEEICWCCRNFDAEKRIEFITNDRDAAIATVQQLREERDRLLPLAYETRPGMDIGPVTWIECYNQAQGLKFKAQSELATLREECAKLRTDRDDAIRIADDAANRNEETSQRASSIEHRCTQQTKAIDALWDQVRELVAAVDEAEAFIRIIPSGFVGTWEAHKIVALGMIEKAMAGIRSTPKETPAQEPSDALTERPAWIWKAAMSIMFATDGASSERDSKLTPDQYQDKVAEIIARHLPEAPAQDTKPEPVPWSVVQNNLDAMLVKALEPTKQTPTDAERIVMEHQATERSNEGRAGLPQGPCQCAICMEHRAAMHQPQGGNQP